MTDDALVRQRAVASILKGVAKKTGLIVSVVAAGLILYGVISRPDRSWWLLPGSVLFGAALGLLNFRWLATAVERVYLRKGATSISSNLAAVVLSLLKLSLIFIILVIVIKWQVFHAFGLVAGLSLCFLAILWQGVTAMKDTRKNQ